MSDAKPRVRTLTDEEQDQVLDRLNKNAPERRCPMCGSSKWVLTPELMELPVHVVAGRQRAFYPSVMITCDICGLMLQIKSSSVGIDTNASKAERETAGANA